MSNDTVNRIYELTDRLQECLMDAEDVRARLTKAREAANTWPDLRWACRLFTDHDHRAN